MHVSTLSVKLRHSDEDLVLDVSINKDLFAEGYYEMDDDVVARRGREHCYYTGRIRGEEQSAVAINTCGEGIEGVFYRGDRRFGVAPYAKEVLEGAAPINFARQPDSHPSTDNGPVELAAHIVYDVEDLIGKPKIDGSSRCPAGEPTLTPMDAAMAAEAAMTEHQHEHAGHEHDHSEHESAAGSRKLLASSKYLELTIINENRMVVKHSTAAATNTYVSNVVNIMTTLYSRFKSVPIQLTLKAQENWVSANPSEVGTVTASTDIQDLLNKFTSWSQKYNRLGASGSPDAIHMFTGWDLSGTVSGVAWVGTVCGRSATGVEEDLGQTYHVWTAETMTHELGHNLGSAHDGSGNSCSKSGMIMAAIGNAGAGRTTSNLQWSSCSESYMIAKIQALSGTPSDCLSNVPTTSYTSPSAPTSVCGDGVVSGSEQCDYAINPTLCGTDCKLKPKTVCSSGACCSSTGQYKQAGVPCRTAVHQCDITDLCNGVSASCPSDAYKPDGTSFNEAGAGGQCHKGTCMGLDGECAEAFTQYKSYGNWVRCGQSSILGNGCGNLVCQIATDRTKQCYGLQDPTDLTTQHFIQVKDYTPCGGVSNKYCLNGQCVYTTSHDVVCMNDCSNQGECSNDGTCVCDSGFTGDDCSQTLTCNQDCTGLGRQGCASPTLCGACQDGRSSVDVNDATTPCIFLQPPILSVNASSAIDDTTAEAAFDHQPYVHWKADFATGLAWITATYPTPTKIVQYEIQSPNTLPQFDPRTWVLQATNDETTPWTTLDSQTDILYEDRHEVLAFHIPEANQGAYTTYRMYFTAVRDVNGFQLQVAEIKLYVDDHTSVRESGSLSPAAMTAPSVFCALALLFSFLH